MSLKKDMFKSQDPNLKIPNSKGTVPWGLDLEIWVLEFGSWILGLGIWDFFRTRIYLRKMTY
jgi:hypothetical protein